VFESARVAPTLTVGDLGSSSPSSSAGELIDLSPVADLHFSQRKAKAPRAQRANRQKLTLSDILSLETAGK
jgi:hypothetical protein